jgi:hypothetical protein
MERTAGVHRRAISQTLLLAFSSCVAAQELIPIRTREP